MCCRDEGVTCRCLGSDLHLSNLGNMMSTSLLFGEYKIQFLWIPECPAVTLGYLLLWPLRLSLFYVCKCSVGSPFLPPPASATVWPLQPIPLSLIYFLLHLWSAGAGTNYLLFIWRSLIAPWHFTNIFTLGIVFQTENFSFFHYTKNVVSLYFVLYSFWQEICYYLCCWYYVCSSSTPACF